MTLPPRRLLGHCDLPLSRRCGIGPEGYSGWALSPFAAIELPPMTTTPMFWPPYIVLHWHGPSWLPTYVKPSCWIIKYALYRLFSAPLSLVVTLLSFVLSFSMIDNDFYLHMLTLTYLIGFVCVHRNKRNVLLNSSQYRWDCFETRND